MITKTENFAVNMPLDFISRYNTKSFEQLKASSTFKATEPGQVECRDKTNPISN